MALAETAKLVASLELKDHFTPAANKAMASLGKLEGRAYRVGQNIGKGFKNAAHNIRNMGIVAAAGIAVAVRGGIQSLAELEDATTSVDGSIKQMGLSGKVTSQQIATWANEIEANVQAAFDDKAIVQATSTLIRFGKVTPGNIRPAMQIITDLATKTGSVDSAATLLAKALADPTKAAGKLARQGVILTKEQQKQIAAFVKAGKVGKAQKVILDSLATSTKGAAAASAGPYRDALNIMSDVTEDAQRALGIGFLPVIQKVAKLLSGELAKKSTIDGIRKFGEGLATGLDSLIEIARNLPWAMIGDSLKIAGAGAKTLLGAFNSLPPWVQTAVLTGWGLNKLTGGALGGIVKELAGGLIKGVLGINAGVVHIKAGAVTGAGGLPAGAGAGAAATGMSGLAKVFLVGEAIGLALLVNEVRTGIETETTKIVTGVKAASDAQIAHNPSRAELTTALAGVEAGIRQLEADPLGTLLIGGPALAALQAIKANTLRALNDKDPITGRDSTTQAETTKGNVFGPQGLGQSITDAQTAAGNKVTTSVEALKGKMATDLAANKTAIAAAGTLVGGGVSIGAQRTVGAVQSGASMVASAVRASTPTVITNVNVSATTVQHTTTVVKRYGNTGGDRDSGDSGGGPGGQ